MIPLHPLLREPVTPAKWREGIERPKKLLDIVIENPEPLMELASRPIVSARQFDRARVAQLCRFSALYETMPNFFPLPLKGKILINAFYEPSTRTRLSFESAWHRLGGDVMSITDPATTGIAKGESLADVAEMFNHYGDVVVLRDHNQEAIYQMLESLRIPIINAGNGIDEHPTQALADIYAIFKWRPQLIEPEVADKDKIRIGIIGVPNKMRTVRSLLIILSLFSQAIHEVVIISDQDHPYDDGQLEELQENGLTVRTSQSLNKELPELDVVYINSIAWIGDSFERLGEELKLNAKSPLKKDAIIMHPLARGDELATDLDETPHNWYFAQARGAVYIRMALLTSVVQRVPQVIDTPTELL
ncbi:MAG: aspartate carbamoyltransferase [Leptospiraceae bacterium]|nr:aspartate carbamoyltransferase [Leptospiraceae bacterium]